MDPAAARSEGPDLRFADPRSCVDTVLVEKLAVDHPGAVRALELEAATDLDPREQLGRSLGYLEERVGVVQHSAVIGGDEAPVHAEFEKLGARRHQTVRLATIGLLQAVDQINLVAILGIRE